MNSEQMAWNMALLSVGLTLTACGGSTEDVSSDKDPNGSYVVPANSALYSEAHKYAEDHPKRDGGTWDQWCASLMWRFGEMPESSARDTAIAASRDSKIESKDASKAPIGAFHWFDIGTAGHVGVDLNGGGKAVFMATTHLADSWGDAIGINSVSGYTQATSAKYLGWSMDYAGSKI